MLSYRYPLIAREGWLWIFLACLPAAIVHFFYGFIALPLWGLVLVLLYVFRDPARKVPAAPLGVVSPVDGKVIAIDKVHDGFIDRPAVCVSIQRHFTDVHSIHSPIEGKVMQQWFAVSSRIRSDAEDGRKPALDSEGDNYAQWIQTDEGDDVVMVIESSAIRPQCYAHSGERIGQGQRCGFIHFGAVVKVLVPETSRLDVVAGQKVTAASDLLATLVRKTATVSAVEAASLAVRV